VRKLFWLFFGSTVCLGKALPPSTQIKIHSLPNGSFPQSDYKPSIVGGETVSDLSDPTYKSTVRILGKGVIAAPAPGLEGKTVSWRCSGVYLSLNTVITAAHCAPQKISYTFENKTYTAQFASHKFEVFSMFKAGSKEFSGVKVTKVVRHPGFVDLWFQNRVDVWNPKDDVSDLALFKLESPLAFQKSPIGGLYGIPDTAGTKLIVAGYGKSSPGSEIDVPELRKAVVPFNQKLLNLTDFVVGKGNFVKPSGDTAPVGACSGDSGGAIYMPSTDHQLALLGIISRGPDDANGGCKSSLTIATAVWPFKKWIETTLKDL
jgi:secreted trypsin-like serine protease